MEFLVFPRRLAKEHCFHMGFAGNKIAQLELGLLFKKAPDALELE